MNRSDLLLLAMCAAVVQGCGNAPAPAEHAFQAQTDCAACHLDGFQTTKDPDHQALGIGTKCDSCHETATWEDALFPMHDDVFVLDGGHAVLACKDCHTGGHYAGTPAVCAGCHQSDYDGADDPDHRKAGFPTACSVCHATVAWDPSTWKGHDTIWPLTGHHTTAKCTSCHAGDVFKGTAKDCAGCHMPEYQGAKTPDHVASQLPTTCETCHTTAGWEPATLDHDQFWPLTGKHEAATCASCHVGGVYEGTAKDCAGCHMLDYQGAKEPDHVASQLPTTCDACHTTAGWAPATLEHDQFWPLEGKHKVAACGACHEAGVYNGTPTDCWSCHSADYQTPKNPDHVAQQLPKKCETCHTAAAWKPASFDHDAYWPLTGKHTTVACTTCHVGGVFVGTQDTCFGCHAADYASTTNPDHETDHLPTTCDACHSTAGWKPAAFEGHDAYWPLLGKHQTTDCAACHVDSLYLGTPKECKACHMPDFQGTLDPNHVALGYPPSCGFCHNPAAWKPASYDGHHDAWALDGKHATAQCTACHANGNFLGTPTQCVGCHEADYAATKDPDHEVEKFPTSCDACHQATAWSPAEFAGHDAYWKRTGAHVNAECASCHIGGKFKGTPKDCKGCHMPKYQATTDPDHEVQGFPTTCDACHGTTKWEPATYSGHDQFWPLTGKHKVAVCSDCHENGVFAGTATECWGCHQGDFTGTKDPDHVSAGFLHTCQTCHGTSAWKPSTFNHAQYWPLTGKHLDTDCAACHTGGTYAGTPKACQSCHLAKWQTAANPNHSALGISKTCDTCHATSSWATNKFPEHDKTFVISYGDHKGNTCAKCHKVTGDWSSFTCLACHSLAKMNSEHQGEVSNYQSTLNSYPTVDAGCLHCHPKGLKAD